MLLRLPVLQAIRAGQVDLAFRRWKKPTVKAGGTLKTQIGVLAIRTVTPITVAQLTVAEARRAGFESLKVLKEKLAAGKAGRLYRVELSFAGEDPRIALREQSELGEEEWSSTMARLGRLDSAAREGAWTQRVLSLILARPAVLAAELAASLGWETQPFKRRVRQLKELGLTESLEIGYRLAPRGEVVLRALKAGDAGVRDGSDRGRG